MICTRILARSKRENVTDLSLKDTPEQKYEVTPLATLAVPPYIALLLVGASVSTLAILAR